MFYLRGEEKGDQSRMRIQHLKEVRQDKNITDELMCLYPCYFINHISCVPVKFPLHAGGYVFADPTRMPLRICPS